MSARVGAESIPGERVAAACDSTTQEDEAVGPARGAAPRLGGWRLAAQTCAVSLAMGAVFGFVMDRSGVANPSSIRAQFLFEREVMLKMFLSALGTSSLVFSAVHYLHPEEFHRSRNARGFGDKGAWTVASGGLVQGCGMAFTGACPGMIMSLLGSGAPDSITMYAGGVVGALAYGLLHPFMERFHLQDFDSTLAHLAPGHLDQIFKVPRFEALSVPFGVAALAAAIAVDRLQPWYADTVNIPGARSVDQGLLNPIAAGIAVGALQLPALLLLSSSLGTSSAYSVVASQYLRFASEEHVAKFRYASGFLKSKAWWQWTYGLGAMLGGYLSSQGVLDGSVASSSKPSVGTLSAFVGGFLLVYGARQAGGCASGHGLSGLSLFSVPGWTAVPSMFAGAILTSLVLSSSSLGAGKDAFLMLN